MQPQTCTGPAARGESAGRAAFAAMVPAFLAHSRETPRLLTAVFEADPELPLAHAAKALMTALLARSELRPAVAQAAQDAARLAARRATNPMESALVRAAGAAGAGEWRQVIAECEAALDAQPDDAFAAKLSHAFRFMLGDKAGMLASIDRVLAHAAPDHPHRGYLFGCKAFALEESGAFAEAEFIGRTGVELAPDDAWGTHAVSHVHEMTGRAAEGASWIRLRRNRFAHCNNFGHHLFWHLALFELELGRTEAVLALYDDHVRAERTDDFRDVANGASLLARLDLLGVDVGARWEELADIAERRVCDRSLAFADLHYLLALLGAGRRDAAQTLAGSLCTLPAGTPAQVEVAREIGSAVADGLLAAFEGRHGDAARLLMRARPRLQAIGGSDAQRDIFEQILLTCLVEARQDDVAEQLLVARLRRRGGANRFAAERLGTLRRRTEGARVAALAAAAMAPSVD